MFWRHSSVALILAFTAGCGAQSVAREAAGPDAPVPSAEPRAVLRATLDLAATQGCEEKFDLALYQDRAVELIEWDGARGACARRSVAIRYLASRTSAERITAVARTLAVRFEPQPQGSTP